MYYFSNSIGYIKNTDTIVFLFQNLFIKKVNNDAVILTLAEQNNIIKWENESETTYYNNYNNCVSHKDSIIF